jgi:hypothetical protein
MKERSPNLVAFAHAAMRRMPAAEAQKICDALETLVTELDEMAHELQAEPNSRSLLASQASNEFGLMAEFFRPKPTAASE